MTATDTRTVENTRADNLIEVGKEVRFKLFNTTGIVIAYTTETPPRYVVRAKDSNGPFDAVANMYEIEAIERAPRTIDEVTASILTGMLKFTPTLPKFFMVPKAAAKRAVEWNDPESEAYFAVASKCKRFVIVERPNQTFNAADRRTGTVTNHVTAGRAFEWCEARAAQQETEEKTVTAPAPAEPITRLDQQHVGPTEPKHLTAQLIWGQPDANNLTRSKCGRFSVVQVRSCGHYVGLDTKTHERSKHLATSAEAKLWCQEHAPKEPAPTVKDVKGIEWIEGTDKPYNIRCHSACRRFNIYGYGNGKHIAHDTIVDQSAPSYGPADEPHKYSPYFISLDDAREWCEDRNEYDVNNSDPHNVRLISKEIPF